MRNLKLNRKSNAFALGSILSILGAVPALGSTPSDEPLRLHFSCQFDRGTEAATNFFCGDLERYFFDTNRQEVKQDTKPDEADIKVTVTAQSRPADIRRYYISFVASARFETPSLVLPWIDIPDAVTLENRRTALQMRILSGVRLYYSTLAGNSVPVPTETSTGNPFYFEAGLSGSGSAKGDVKSTNFSNSYSATYFPKNERFRFDLDASGTWVSQTIPGATGVLKGEIFVPQITVSGLYSVDKKKRWSVAIITDKRAAAGANLRNFERITAGVEYILVPYLTNQTKQVSISLGPQWNQLSLMSPNSSDHLHEKLLSAFAQIVYVNQFANGKMNLIANAKVTAYPTLKGFNQYSGGATVSYRIGRNILLNATGTYQQMKKSLTYPGKLNYSNPAQLLFLDEAPGKNISYSFGAKFTMGGTAKKSNDWRFAKRPL